MNALSTKCFNKGMGELVVRRRKELGIPQYALAEKLGFSAQFLGRLEKGKAPIPAPSMKKVVKLLGIKSKEFHKVAAESVKVYAETIGLD